MRVYTLKELKTMSVKELVKILVKISMSTNKSSKQLEKVILNILAEREAAEYKRMMTLIYQDIERYMLIMMIFTQQLISLRII